MTLFVAIVAFDDDTLGLHLLLGAVLGHVANLAAPHALGKTAGNNVTSVCQALEDFLMALRPTLFLSLAARLVRQAIVDGVFLTEVALQVHVGQGNGQVGTLEGNQVEAVTLGAEGLLELGKGGLGLGLDVNLDLLLDLINIALADGALEQVPGLLARHVWQVAAIDVASILASGSDVTWRTCVSRGLEGRERKILVHLPSWPQFLQVAT